MLKPKVTIFISFLLLINCTNLYLLAKKDPKNGEVLSANNNQLLTKQITEQNFKTSYEMREQEVFLNLDYTKEELDQTQSDKLITLKGGGIEIILGNDDVSGTDYVYNGATWSDDDKEVYFTKTVSIDILRERLKETNFKILKDYYDSLLAKNPNRKTFNYNLEGPIPNYHAFPDTLFEETSLFKYNFETKELSFITKIDNECSGDNWSNSFPDRLINNHLYLDGHDVICKVDLDTKKASSLDAKDISLPETLTYNDKYKKGISIEDNKTTYLYFSPNKNAFIKFNSKRNPDQHYTNDFNVSFYNYEKGTDAGSKKELELIFDESYSRDDEHNKKIELLTAPYQKTEKIDVTKLSSNQEKQIINRLNIKKDDTFIIGQDNSIREYFKKIADKGLKRIVNENIKTNTPEELKIIKEIKSIIPEDATEFELDAFDFEEDGVDEYIVSFKSKNILVPCAKSSKSPFWGFQVFRYNGNKLEKVYQDHFCDVASNGWVMEEFLMKEGGKALKVTEYIDGSGGHIDESIIKVDGNISIGTSSYAIINQETRKNLEKYLNDQETFSSADLDSIEICREDLNEQCLFKHGRNIASLRYDIGYENGEFFIIEDSIRRKKEYMKTKNELYFGDEKISDGKSSYSWPLGDNGYMTIDNWYYHNAKPVSKEEFPLEIIEILLKEIAE